MLIKKQHTVFRRLHSASTNLSFFFNSVSQTLDVTAKSFLLSIKVCISESLLLWMWSVCMCATGNNQPLWSSPHKRALQVTKKKCEAPSNVEKLRNQGWHISRETFWAYSVPLFHVFAWGSLCCSVISQLWNQRRERLVGETTPDEIADVDFCTLGGKKREKRSNENDFINFSWIFILFETSSICCKTV